MEYPIYIEGRRSGTLTETAEGLYTVFQADCPRRNGLIRLWLHGGGQSACLGLLAFPGDTGQTVSLGQPFHLQHGIPCPLAFERRSVIILTQVPGGHGQIPAEADVQLNRSGFVSCVDQFP